MDFFCKIERVEHKPINLKEKEKIFYTDKHSPILKDDFIIHKNIITSLDNMIEGGISNLSFYGQKDMVNIHWQDM